jgi:hypothetical protein
MKFCSVSELLGATTRFLLCHPRVDARSSSGLLYTTSASIWRFKLHGLNKYNAAQHMNIVWDSISIV